MNKTAVFIEMMSIQKYIFKSNKLKENVGASYIVDNIFKELKDNYEYSYIGGGNAFLYFDSLEEAKNAMRKWSRDLLLKAPSLVPVIAIEENFDKDNYIKSRELLIKHAKKRENSFIPQTELRSFGITTDCSRTGLSAEVWEHKLPKNERNYISSVSYSKDMMSEESNNRLHEDFSCIIGDYKFPNELDNLGGSKGENSHIAVVHIDGNDMGKKFREKNSETEIREFSEGLKKAVKDSFGDALKSLIDKIPQLVNCREISIVDKYLPVRPIVIGGDDITFVCDARVGLFLTMEIIRSFENQKICKENGVTACAGISIVKTKYPFYRAYKMAEALCNNAKRTRKDVSSGYSDDDSLIDFHISFGGLGGSLQDIREANYKSADGKWLYKRPYSIKNIPKLLECVTNLSNMPQTSVKKLREVLYEGETSTTEFIKELKYRGRNLLYFSHNDESEKGFSNSKSPYIDIIELIDFCPKTLLQKEKNDE